MLRSTGGAGKFTFPFNAVHIFTPRAWSCSGSILPKSNAALINLGIVTAIAVYLLSVKSNTLACSVLCTDAPYKCTALTKRVARDLRIFQLLAIFAGLWKLSHKCDMSHPCDTNDELSRTDHWLQCEGGGVAR